MKGCNPSMLSLGYKIDKIKNKILQQKDPILLKTEFTINLKLKSRFLQPIKKSYVPNHRADNPN